VNWKKVEFLKFDGDFWQPVLFTLSLLAVFRDQELPFSQAGKPAREQEWPECSLFPPVPKCCFEVTNKSKYGLRGDFIGKDYCKVGKGNL